MKKKDTNVDLFDFLFSRRFFPNSLPPPKPFSYSIEKCQILPTDFGQIEVKSEEREGVEKLYTDIDVLNVSANCTRKYLFSTTFIVVNSYE